MVNCLCLVSVDRYEDGAIGAWSGGWRAKNSQSSKNLRREFGTVRWGFIFHGGDIIKSAPRHLLLEGIQGGVQWHEPLIVVGHVVSSQKARGHLVLL